MIRNICRLKWRLWPNGLSIKRLQMLHFRKNEVTKFSSDVGFVCSLIDDAVKGK